MTRQYTISPVLDLGGDLGARPWLTDQGQYWASVDGAVADIDGPVAVIEVSALRANVADLRRRAGATPIRVASKSLRVRAVIEEILDVPGYAGVLAYDVAEAQWLASDRPASSQRAVARNGIEDVLLGYPSADRRALAGLCRDQAAVGRVALLIDSIEQLDLIDALVPPSARPSLRVAIDLDVSYHSKLLGHVGVRRSPVHTVEQAATLAAAIAARPGFTLVGVMSYEAQIAGVGNRVPGKPVFNRLIGAIQRRSMDELRVRRAAAVAAIRQTADLEFVNAGGTGSLELTATDPSVTDIAAGSGFFGGHLFDNYAHFRPAPAAAFGLSVVRKPTADIVTCHGGGWIASGPPAPDRLPKPVWPSGLSYLPREAAGEVQTPLRGRAARDLAIGSRVWFRHTKSGELSEHVEAVVLVEDGAVVGRLPTYRGEGKCFL